MIKFFRDVLSGPLYVVVALLALVLIMAIIGFIMERLKLEKEEKGRIAYVNNKIDTPVEEVNTPESTVVPSTPITQLNNESNNNEIPSDLANNPSLLVKTPVVVFDDPEKSE